jgi:tartrate dehydrogenase/decarboxylase/D-malate dehydrogenase
MPAPSSPDRSGAQREFRLAVIGGDGIGPEVVEAGLEVLAALSRARPTLGFAVTRFGWSSERRLRTGRYIPEGGLAELRRFDAILFGAVGSREVPDHESLWGLRLPIVQGFDQYANVRPARLLPGVESPLRAGGAIDWVIVRENSEGEYAGHGGRAHRGLPIEVGTETAIFTRAGVERIHRFAFELARRRPRKRLTLVTKSNALRFGMVLWDEIFYELAAHYPDVQVDRELVDAATAHGEAARVARRHRR